MYSLLISSRKAEVGIVHDKNSSNKFLLKQNSAFWATFFIF